MERQYGVLDLFHVFAVQNRAMRFFMGVNKYTPNDDIFGDMAWKPVYVNQWNCIFRHWSRCVKMNEERVNFKIFRWSFNSAVMNKRNMCFKVKKNWSF